MSGADSTFASEAREVRRLEVINGAPGRRRWSAETKARIVAESLPPGVVVSVRAGGMAAETRAQRLFKEAVLDDLPDPFDLRWKRMRAFMGRHELPEELKAELRWADGIEVGLPRQPWWKRW